MELKKGSNRQHKITGLVQNQIWKDCMDTRIPRELRTNGRTTGIFFVS